MGIGKEKGDFAIKWDLSIESICEPFDGILLDAYGVFWGGNDVGLLPGCKTAMERLIAKGKIIGILSNSTQLAKTEIGKLTNHGLIQGQHFHFFITSGTLAKRIFLTDTLPFPTPNKKFYLLFYIGKSSAKMYSAAMQSFQDFGISNTKKVLMVGDTSEIDIRGARNYGMPSALIIKTGIMADRIVQKGLERAFQDLSPDDFPNFFIEYM